MTVSHVSVDKSIPPALVFLWNDVCVCFEVCVEYSMYLLCPALIRGMEGLRSAVKVTLS